MHLEARKSTATLVNCHQATSRRYNHIDDLLGPSSGRFFGSGYKNSEYHVHLTKLAAGDRSFIAGIELAIADKWSLKASNKQLPHVSTTDVIALALTLSEQCLEQTRPGVAEGLILCDMQVRAPNKPAEGNNYKFDGYCEIETAGNDPAEIETSTKMLGFSIQARFKQLDRKTRVATRRSEELTSALWREGFKLSTNSIENVRIDDDGNVAIADLHRRPSKRGERMTGIDSAFQEYPSLIDVFVSAMQLGQSLIYALDNIDRSASNALWMRSLSIQTSPDQRLQFSPVDGLHCVIKRTNLLPGDEVHAWRSALLEMGIPGVSMQCNLVHKIPRKVS